MMEAAASNGHYLLQDLFSYSKNNIFCGTFISRHLSYKFISSLGDAILNQTQETGRQIFG